ncbi:AsmA family protein [Guyparkeria halophila]|uniref:AsmA family protein n=1 Tax=Guyparkeria halophila TaxID=47960 RepID=A0ABZ0YZL5_9GAMM|nr:AsmA family protein [Guyparkeria halophila]WQH16712.1 AsmA family protein [Guyparkeria halophila]
MKWIKRIGLLIVAIVMVAILAIVAFALTFDPNDYKPQIAAQVEKQTGRSIQFNGDLSVTIFPWLGAATEDVVLANAEGFEPEAMVEIKRLEAQAALLPLLRGEFEIGTLLLEDAQIHLTRHEDGRNNWDDLLERSAESAEASTGEPDTVEPQDGDGPAMVLTVGGVDIRNATLHWRDEQADQQLTIDGLDLTTGELADGAQTDIELVSGFRLAMPDMPVLSGSVDLSTRAQLWLDRQDMLFEGIELNLVASHEEGIEAGLPERIEAMLQVEKADVRLAKSQARLDGVVLDLNGKGVGPLTYLESRLETVLEADWSAERYQLPRLSLSADLKGLPEVDGTLSVSASAMVDADLAAGTASISDLVLASDPVRASGQVDVGGLDSGELVASGPIEIAAFDPRELADRLGMTVPEMRSDEALRAFALTGQIDVTPARAMLNELRITLDDNELTGRAGIDNLETGRLFARLQGGDLNANPYLAPTTQDDKGDKDAGGSSESGNGGSAQSVAAARSAEIELPVETLRGLNLDARLQLASLRYEDYRLTSPVVHVTAAGGRVQLAELTANAFDGAINASGGLDVRGEVPSYAGKGRVQGVSLQPLLTAVMDEDRLLGKGDVAFDVTTQGKRVDQLKSGLDGTADFALRDGKVKGFDIGYLLRRAQARLEGQTEPEPEELSTDFTAITGTAAIRNGVVRNDDLAGSSPLLRVAGEGQVDLPREEIDYGLTVTVVNTATGQGGKDLERLKQVPVPIRIKGTFSDPSISLDLESLAKEAVKSEVKERVEEEIDKRLKDKGGDAVKELIKGFGL